MLFDDATFRNLLYTMIVVKSKKDAEYQEKLFNIDSIDFKNFEKEFESISIEREVNAMLLFPYLDYTQGLSFLLITNGMIEDDKVTLYNRPNFDTFQIIRKDGLKGKELFYLKDLLINSDFDLEYHMNYFLTYFFKEGLNPEGMWVRGMELKKDYILAELLNQPRQDFGINAGDIIKVIVYEDESGGISCIADLR